MCATFNRLRGRLAPLDVPERDPDSGEIVGDGGEMVKRLWGDCGEISEECAHGGAHVKRDGVWKLFVRPCVRVRAILRGGRPRVRVVGVHVHRGAARAAPSRIRAGANSRVLTGGC